METAILYLFIYIVEAVILFWYCSTLFESTHSKTYKTIFFLLTYGILYLLSFFKNIWINNMSFAIATILILITVYNIKWSISLFHSLIVTSIMALSEIAIVGLSSSFNTSTLIIETNLTYLIIITVASKILYLLCLKIISCIIPGQLDKSERNNKATVLLIIISLISLYIAMALTIFILNNTMSDVSRFILCSCSVLLLANNILFYYTHQYIIEKNKEFTDMHVLLQREYDTGTYYKTLLKQTDNQRILVHDIRKHLTTISSLNEKNDSVKIKKYLNTLLNSSDLQDSVQVSDNELLNSILCHYINLCHNNNITIKVDIRKDSLHFFDYTDLTALFCNILDNASEACLGVPDSFIELSISPKAHTTFTIINIINTCTTSPTFDKNNNPISHKRNHRNHGIGTQSIKRVVDKYNGNIKMYYEDDKNLFHTIIMVCSK